MIDTVLLGIITFEMSVIFILVIYDQFDSWNSHRKFINDNNNYIKNKNKK